LLSGTLIINLSACKFQSQAQNSTQQIQRIPNATEVPSQVLPNNQFEKKYPNVIANLSNVKGETYGNKLVYSPYLISSFVVAEQRSLMGQLEQTYLYQVAKSEYEMALRVVKTSDHNSLNLMV
jgi:hypothetical protein